MILFRVENHVKVHHTFVRNTNQLMEWLLRVFFASSIGFQVPVDLFQDAYVIGMGFQNIT